MEGNISSLQQTEGFIVHKIIVLLILSALFSPYGFAFTFDQCLLLCLNNIYSGYKKITYVIKSQLLREICYKTGLDYPDRQK